MALRCLIAKLGNNNKFFQSKARVVMLGTFHVIELNQKESLSMTFPTPGRVKFRDLENPMATRKQSLDYHTELGGLRTAHFALEEFNKIKKAQLQLVRVLGFWMKPQDYPHSCLYVVIMKAVDAGGVTLLHQARVRLHVTQGLFLEAFYRCSNSDLHGIGYVKLYHHLDNFYDSMYPGTIKDGDVIGTLEG